ncbi:uncharacterized protein N7459_001774 [Penicillium hispanicum]|uniref:uncharacterized protein n=1 Tax=Penicillium hispanicum TaxID=1080232 RepID=UPI00254062E3|nr:uncharacterized protein N7459_001774 [Penicillium hispanicum]KAJ5595566.1 hypothetical protein N7459_001774 [Penicillium hispanicum]
MAVKWTTGAEPVGIVTVLVKFFLWYPEARAVEVNEVGGVECSVSLLVLVAVKFTTGADPGGTVIEVGEQPDNSTFEKGHLMHDSG